MVPGAPQVFTQSYNHPHVETISSWHVSIADTLKEVYDSREDETRTQQVQEYIRQYHSKLEGVHPIANYQTQIVPQYSGPVRTYVPTYPAMQPAQYQVPDFAVNTQVQTQKAEDEPLSMKQMIQFMTAMKAADAQIEQSPEQFVQTRKAAREGGSGSSNF